MKAKVISFKTPENAFAFSEMFGNDVYHKDCYGLFEVTKRDMTGTQVKCKRCQQELFAPRAYEDFIKIAKESFYLRIEQTVDSETLEAVDKIEEKEVGSRRFLASRPLLGKDLIRYWFPKEKIEFFEEKEKK